MRWNAEWNVLSVQLTSEFCSKSGKPVRTSLFFFLSIFGRIVPVSLQMRFTVSEKLVQLCQPDRKRVRIADVLSEHARISGCKSFCSAHLDHVCGILMNESADQRFCQPQQQSLLPQHSCREADWSNRGPRVERDRRWRNREKARRRGREKV